MALRIVHLSVICLAAITAADAFFLGDIDASKEMLDCHSEHRVNKGSHYSCYDNVKVELCLKDLVPVKELDKKKIQTLIYDNNNERMKCPGFVGTNTCRESESKKCKEVFNAKLLFGDDTVCQEVNKVRDCVWSKLNYTCSDDVIREELSEVEDKDRDCKNENVQCRRNTILSCTDPVYLDQYSNDEKGFSCNATLVAIANDCLTSLEKECKTDDMKREIKGERTLLSRTCN